MQKLSLFFIVFLTNLEHIFAERLGIGVSPDNSLASGNGTSWELIDILGFIEGLLLRVALPLVIVGSSIYIAYELFLAQGNEEKMKQAWKSMTYAFI